MFLFFSFQYDDIRYPCALIHWFSTLGDTPDDETGMWVVRPDYLAHRKCFLGVIHLDTIMRGAHLIGVPGADFLPSYPKIGSTMSLVDSSLSMSTSMPIITRTRSHSNSTMY